MDKVEPSSRVVGSANVENIKTLTLLILSSPVSWLMLMLSSFDVSPGFRGDAQVPEVGTLVKCWHISNTEHAFEPTTGSIPPQMGALGSLRILDLSRNQLSGECIVGASIGLY